MLDLFVLCCYQFRGSNYVPISIKYVIFAMFCHVCTYFMIFFPLLSLFGGNKEIINIITFAINAECLHNNLLAKLERR